MLFVGRATLESSIPQKTVFVIAEGAILLVKGVINTHRAMPLAQLWGAGTTSSSDGQYFRAGDRRDGLADINARHGNEPGVTFYTHLSDQVGPYYTKVIAATATEAPHVLDGSLYHQTGLQIEEHYTDTGGATDHVFGLCHLFGFRSATSRIVVPIYSQGRKCNRSFNDERRLRRFSATSQGRFQIRTDDVFDPADAGIL